MRGAKQWSNSCLLQKTYGNYCRVEKNTCAKNYFLAVVLAEGQLTLHENKESYYSQIVVLKLSHIINRLLLSCRRKYQLLVIQEKWPHYSTRRRNWWFNNKCWMVYWFMWKNWLVWRFTCRVCVCVTHHEQTNCRYFGTINKHYYIYVFTDSFTRLNGLLFS